MPESGIRNNELDLVAVKAVPHAAPGLTATAIAILVILFATAAISGWVFGVSLLTTVGHGLASMKFNTGLCFIALGLAVVAPQFPATVKFSRAPAIFVALLAGGTLVEYAFSIRLGIDELFVMDPWSSSLPGRPSLATSTCFVLLALSILSLDVFPRVSSLLTSLASMIATVAIIGYAFSIEGLYSVYMFSSMAINTAAAFLLLSLAIVLSRPEGRFVSIVLSDSIAGVMARRLTPLIPMVLLGIGMIQVHATRAGWYHGIFGISLTISLAIFVSLAVIVWTTRGVHFAELRADSSRRLLEEQRAKVSEAQKLEAIGRLASAVAHDFNNQLMSIAGYSELAQGTDSSDELKECLEQITLAADKSAALACQLLTLGRKQPVEPVIMNLNAHLEESEKLLARLVRADVHLVFRLGERLDTIKVDPTQIDQIIMNLVVNALDAIEGDGEVVIETANVALDAGYSSTHAGVTEGDYVMLAVTDSGSGIAPEIQSNIFEAFFTTKGPGEGTGLGLATVHGIVKQNGGHIWLYSEQGHGTAFEIYFPVARGVQIRKQVVRAQPVDGIHARVLVVEDQPELRRLIERALTKAGCRVSAATDGLDALDLAEAENFKFDVLVTDLIMPQMCGGQLVSELRKRECAPATIYMSGYTRETCIAQGLLNDDSAFLQKPVSPATLVREVAATVAAARQPSSRPV